MAIAPATLRRLCRARDQLREPDAGLVSIADVAREARLSTCQFIRQFAAVFGDTPHQFRIRTRLERARDLLASGSMSVTEVCYEVGFESLGSFSDLFARRVGEAPSRYQRRVRTLLRVPSSRTGYTLEPGCLSLMAHLPPDTAIFKKHPGRR